MNKVETSLPFRRSFLLEALQPTQLMQVTDIGANPLNQPLYHDFMMAGGCHVTAFEPQKDAYDQLLAAKLDNVSYVNAAVGPTGHATLNVYPHSGLASIFRLSRPAVGYLGRFLAQLGKETRFELALTALDEIDEISRIDVLKMDVQGSELAILQTGATKLAQAVCIIPEVRFMRLYEDEPMFGEVDGELRRQGFALHKFLRPNRSMLRTSQDNRLAGRRSGNQLVDGDAVYIRNMEDTSDWTDDQIRYLALAADAFFNSVDLVVRCLDILVARKLIAEDVPARYVDLLPEEFLKS